MKWGRNFFLFLKNWLILYFCSNHSSQINQRLPGHTHMNISESLRYYFNLMTIPYKNYKTLIDFVQRHWWSNNPVFLLHENTLTYNFWSRILTYNFWIRYYNFTGKQEIVRYFTLDCGRNITLMFSVNTDKPYFGNI